MILKDINGVWHKDEDLHSLVDLFELYGLSQDYKKPFEKALFCALRFSENIAMTKDDIESLSWIVDYYGNAFDEDGNLVELTDEWKE